MVGNASVEKPARQRADVAEGLIGQYPELRRIASAAGETPIYVVGGAVRDLLAGRGRTDLDIAVEGDPLALARRLDPEAALVRHDRFQTATLHVDGLAVDLARSRRERYVRPGALPEVEPAPIEEDLARRDFTVNAMAVRVGEIDRPEDWELIDPFGGERDLAEGRLRLLHPDSIRDDPTRTLRGARYAALYNLRPDTETAAQLAATDLDAVSAERRRADLVRILECERAAEALALLEEWGAARLRPDWRERLARVEALLESPPWRDCCDATEAKLAAVWPEAAPTGLPPAERPETPAGIVDAARRHSPLELLLARADGADWLDEYMSRLRHVELEIGGDDLIAAGVEAGPAIGRGLKLALERKLNGEISGREAELAAALEAAGRNWHD